MTTTAIPASARLLDAAAVICLGAGGALFARAFFAMRHLERGAMVPGSPSGSAIDQFNYYGSLASTALMVAAAGIALAVAAAATARQRVVGAD